MIFEGRPGQKLGQKLEDSNQTAWGVCLTKLAVANVSSSLLLQPPHSNHPAACCVIRTRGARYALTCAASVLVLLLCTGAELNITSTTSFANSRTRALGTSPLKGSGSPRQVISSLQQRGVQCQMCDRSRRKVHSCALFGRVSGELGVVGGANKVPLGSTAALCRRRLHGLC